MRPWYQWPLGGVGVGGVGGGGSEAGGGRRLIFHFSYDAFHIYPHIYSHSIYWLRLKESLGKLPKESRQWANGLSLVTLASCLPPPPLHPPNCLNAPEGEACCLYSISAFSLLLEANTCSMQKTW